MCFEPCIGASYLLDCIGGAMFGWMNPFTCSQGATQLSSGASSYIWRNLLFTVVCMPRTARQLGSMKCHRWSLLGALLFILISQQFVVSLDLFQFKMSLYFFPQFMFYSCFCLLSFIFGILWFILLACVCRYWKLKKDLILANEVLWLSFCKPKPCNWW